ncbi:glycosyltransferase [Anabaena sp. CCY 9910]|uniref:glycosyltransferase n=1 Tax=Anabaena sp. CCY 9910 TaxID=3103870 RepID=UPI0039E0AEFB
MNPSSPTAPSRTLKITLLTIGSRGDVQPYCALGMGLKRAGHEVTVATNENFESFVRQCDLEFVAIAPNIQEFLQSHQGQRFIAGEKLESAQEQKLLTQQMQSAWAACQGTDVIIYTPLTNWAYNIAEKLGIPCFFASVIPMTPTGAFGFMKFAHTAKNPLKKVINYASYFIAEFMYWQRYRELINTYRTETLQLPPLPYLGKRFRIKAPANVARIPVLYGFSSHVIPRPQDWPVCVVKDVPHDWLLPQVSAMIHHGGASTTAATLRAGIPSIVVPFFADQPVWGELLMKLGVSPAPIPYKKVTEDSLAAVIKVMLGDEAMRLKAQELGEKIRAENGVVNAVAAFHRYLGLL